MKKNHQTSSSHKEQFISKKTNRYLIVGIILSVFNYGLYIIIASFIDNPKNLWLSSLIANTFTTILAFILHSHITWKKKNITIIAKVKFFIWNIITAQLIGPFLIQVFSLITPIYEFAYNISAAIHLPFDYSFIQATGTFVFTSVITMTINYLFYDKFVFGEPKPIQPKHTTTDQ